MNRNDILQELIEKETGRTFAASSIWKEIEEAASNYQGEDGTTWVTGQDDVLMKWEYYIEITRTYDKEYDQWIKDVHLLEIRINDKNLKKIYDIKVQGAIL